MDPSTTNPRVITAEKVPEVALDINQNIIHQSQNGHDMSQTKDGQNFTSREHTQRSTVDDSSTLLHETTPTESTTDEGGHIMILISNSSTQNSEVCLDPDSEYIF